MKKPELQPQLKELLNTQNNSGDTVLHLAESEGKETLTNYLRTQGVSKGLDLSIRNNNGLTVDEAKERKRKELKEEDDRKKADVDITTEKKLDKKKNFKNKNYIINYLNKRRRNLMT